MRAPPLLAVCGLFALACSAGCGLKGPLYLPSAEEKRETAERAAALAERERRERATEPEVQPTPAPSEAPSQTSPSAAPAN